ncbi:MAG: RluA family pseudouridine synthase [Anaerolineae bacterium]|nr:RluA family pseudouridine synthase [Anaerolineae bacterium]
METTFTIDQGGERLDKLLLLRLPELSRAQIQTLIRDGLITVDGRQIKAGHKLKGGETVFVRVPEVEVRPPEAENIPLTILYDDDDLAIIDKPAGLVVHPGAGNPTGTLVNALLARYPHLAQMAADDDSDDEPRTGIVHRLDKDTSGLLVVAKHTAALTALMEQFRERRVAKTYIALTERTPKTLFGTIDAPIGRDRQQRQRMNVMPGGRAAVTEFHVLETHYRDGRALLRCHPHTGRTHQIRVHLAFVGCPVVGDTVYGLKRKYPDFKRHFLHAAALSFDHPADGRRLTFEAPLPPELTTLLDWLREPA